mgnify:CR=1 FL=1
MKTFIHLRGTHGVGKTSTARSLIERAGSDVRSIDIDGKGYPYTICGNGWAVTGRYDTRV